MDSRTPPDLVSRPASSGASARLACIREIVSEVREMVAKAETAGLHSKAASLRLLAKHYEAEATRVETEPAD